MQFIYHTNRLILRILTPECAPLVNKFYQDNRKFLEPFEPNRPGNFYTNDFHYCNLRCEYDGFPTSVTGYSARKILISQSAASALAISCWVLSENVC